MPTFEMTARIFEQTYNTIAAQNEKAFVPHLAAPYLAGLLGINDKHLLQDILAIMSNPKAKLYPDAGGFLNWINGRDAYTASIWTQGEFEAPDQSLGYQQKKIQSAKIPDALGKTWKRNKKKNLDEVVGGMNKIQMLDYIANQLCVARIPSVVLVDDKRDNLEAATDILLRRQLAVYAFWVDRGREARSSDDLTIVHSLQEVGHYKITGPAHWLVDLDYTLIDHGEVRRQMQTDLTKRLARI